MVLRNILIVFCLLLLAGLRQQEIIKIEIDQVFLTAHQIRYMEADGPYFRIIRSKQGQPMGIPITPPMASIFERRINAARQIGSKYVFPSPRPRGGGVTGGVGCPVGGLLNFICGSYNHLPRPPMGRLWRAGLAVSL